MPDQIVRSERWVGEGEQKGVQVQVDEICVRGFEIRGNIDRLGFVSTYLSDNVDKEL